MKKIARNDLYRTSISIVFYSLYSCNLPFRFVTVFSTSRVSFIVSPNSRVLSYPLHHLLNHFHSDRQGVSEILYRQHT